jgi:O-antigen ligase
MPKSDWKALAQSAGKANVHCDLLQFLTEFGIVGFGFMLAAVTTLILSLFPLPKGVRVLSSRRDPLLIMGVIGLSLVVVFSLIDLPFRCPAILCTWVLILAALPKVTETKVHKITINP